MEISMLLLVKKSLLLVTLAMSLHSSEAVRLKLYYGSYSAPKSITLPGAAPKNNSTTQGVTRQPWGIGYYIPPPQSRMEEVSIPGEEEEEEERAPPEGFPTFIDARDQETSDIGETSLGVLKPFRGSAQKIDHLQKI